MAGKGTKDNPYTKIFVRKNSAMTDIYGMSKTKDNLIAVSFGATRADGRPSTRVYFFKDNKRNNNILNDFRSDRGRFKY